MKHPTDSEFDVEVTEASITITFNPTRSSYKFARLADARDIAQFGPLSLPPSVRHGGPTGDLNDYWPDEVERIAKRLALSALKGR